MMSWVFIDSNILINPIAKKKGVKNTYDKWHTQSHLWRVYLIILFYKHLTFLIATIYNSSFATFDYYLLSILEVLLCKNYK